MESDKLNILFPMTIDNASLNVSPAAVNTLPAENIFNSRRDRFMRILSSSATIKFNANELNVISGVGIGVHNFEEGSTVRVRVYDGFNQTGNITHDSGAIVTDVVKPFGEWIPGVDPVYATWQLGDLLPQVFFHAFNQVIYKSVRIDISAPNNTEIDVGRVMVGFVFEPEINYSHGSKWQWVETGDSTTASSKYRIFSFELHRLRDMESDRYEYEKIKTSKQDDLLVCLMPSATGLERLKNTAICKRVNDILRVRTHNNINKHSDIYQEVYK
jgi:hypothetical protein